MVLKEVKKYDFSVFALSRSAGFLYFIIARRHN
jgi:hypothetical protein